MFNSLKIKDIDLLMINQNYDNPELIEKGKKNSKDQVPLYIENLEKETTPCILKGIYKRTTHKPNAQAPPNYSIVEYLAQTSCAMSTL